MTPFLTVNEAHPYFETRFDSDAWDAEAESNQFKALCSATRLINMLNFAGCKTDEAQENEFPRNGKTVIPQQILDATCEIAIALIEGRNVEFDAESQWLDSINTEIAKVSKDSASYNEAALHLIPSLRAWHLIRPFLRDGNLLRIYRVN